MLGEAEIQLKMAIRVATSALERYELPQGEIGESVRKDAFRQWRDASDLAVKWHRQLVRSGGEADSFDDEMTKLLGVDT